MCVYLCIAIIIQLSHCQQHTRNTGRRSRRGSAREMARGSSRFIISSRDTCPRTLTPLSFDVELYRRRCMRSGEEWFYRPFFISFRKSVLNTIESLWLNVTPRAPSGILFILNGGNYNTEPLTLLLLTPRGCWWWWQCFNN